MNQPTNQPTCALCVRVRETMFLATLDLPSGPTVFIATLQSDAHARAHVKAFQMRLSPLHSVAKLQRHFVSTEHSKQPNQPLGSRTVLA